MPDDPSDLVPALKRTGRPDGASLAQVLAALLWLPQAALLALAVQRLNRGGGLSAVLAPAVGIALLGLLRAAAEAWGVRRSFDLARAQLTRLRLDAAQALAARSPLDRGRPPSGLAASVLAEQAEAVLPWLARYRPVRWRVLLVPPVIVLAVATQSWLAALILLVAAPLIPVFMAIVGWRAQAASQAQMLQLGSMNAFLLDRLRGLATLRALGAVDATALRLRASAQDLRRRTMAVLRVAFLSSAVLELFSALGVAMVAVYVGFHLLGVLGWGSWGTRLTLGQALFVLLLTPAFFEPLRDLAAVWHDRAAGEAALAALAQLRRDGIPLPGATASSDAPPQQAPVGPPGVQVRELCFAHAGEAPLFDQLDLSIQPGEHVALVGPSGAGKSVLLSLIAGLLPLQHGRIEVGGIALDDRHAAALRARIGWMGQRAHVFCAPLTHNVHLARAGIDAAQVQAALRFAELGELARARPTAALGEGGSGLSGGELARLALARLAANPRADLLLVDEPTAHLDSATAERVTSALLELARGRTLVVATHDPLLAARVGRAIELAAPAGWLLRERVGDKAAVAALPFPAPEAVA